MGFIHPGVPQELVARLAQQFGITTFVETGTHKGKTAEWASGLFRKVITIEGSEKWYQATKERLAAVPNIEILFGHSAQVLPDVVRRLEAPALFWLDAHWSGRQTAGAEDQCPLLSEIAAVNASPLEHFVLIDDARLFLSPPEAPHNLDQWPEIAAVLAALNTPRPRFCVVFEDGITAVPPAAKSLVRAYCLERDLARKNRSLMDSVADRVRRALRR